MTTVLLHLFRLLPFLVGGHRQPALENLALRHQLVVYKRTASRSCDGSAAWTAQQLVDAFPEESAPAFLLRDRDDASA